MAKTKSFVRHGENDPKRTVTQPKDWAFRRTGSEGRVKKEKRAKPIKLKHVVWGLMDTILQLLQSKAGLPECRWMITCNNPARVMTPVDILRVMSSSEDEIEVRFNDDHRVLQFEDLSTILT